MPQAPPIPRPQQSLKALQTLRERIRRAFLMDGLCALSLLSLLLAGATFLMDYSLVLPRVVRAVLLAQVAALLAWALWRRLLRPAQVALGEEALAVLVEARAPEMKQALITAVELSRAGHRGAPHLSPVLISEVVRQAEEASVGIQPGRVLDVGPIRRNAFLAVVVAAVLLTGAAVRPDLAGTWFRRLFFLSQDRWPKTTELALVLPRENPVWVAMGDDLAVEVRVVRGAPGKIEVEQRSEDGTTWREPLAEGGDGLHHKLFENVAQAFRFEVSGGDDVLPEVEVRVRIQPALSRLDAWYSYPEYTALPSTPPEKPVSNPSLITVPAGTSVSYRAFTDRPVKQAFFVFKAREEAGGPGGGPGARAGAGSGAGPGERAGGGDRSAAAGGAPAAPALEPGALELRVASPPPPAEGGSPAAGPPQEARAGSMLSGEFTVEKDGLFFFQLIAQDGLPGRTGKTVSVRAIADRKPLVRIVEPGRASEEVSAEATVPMEFFIRDDYGVKSASLEGVLFRSDQSTEKPQSFPLALEPAAREGSGTAAAKGDHRSRFTLDLARIPGAVPGSRFSYYARAEDFGGQTGESEHFVLHLVTKENLSRILNDRLMLVRDQLREVFHQEESARKDLQNFQGELQASAKERPPRIDAAAASKLGRTRQDQERVTAGLKRAVKEFDQILQKREANRVGEEKETAWIRGLRGEVESLAKQGSPQVEKMVEEVRAQAARDPQPTDRLNPIIEGQRKLERDIQMLVLRLSEFGDVNAVIQQLRDLQRRQAEIRDRTRNRARAAGGLEEKGGTGEEGTR